MKKAAAFIKENNASRAKATGKSGRAGLATMQQGAVTPTDTGSAKMAGNTRGIMRNGGNTPKDVKLPTGYVRDTMRQ